MRFLSKTNLQNQKSIATPFMGVAMFFLILFSFSCNKESTEVVSVAFDPETTFTIRATGVSNLVSDSGIVRYRITADEWIAYDKAADPYWYFPQGVYLEKFDTLFTVEASIKADTAYFYTKRELWEGIRNVKVENLEGERFETEHLFWDQKTGRVYSNEYIRVEKADKIITGIGFESNQEMTRYSVFNSQGVFPVSETPINPASMASDSTAVELPPDISVPDLTD